VRGPTDNLLLGYPGVANVNITDCQVSNTYFLQPRYPFSYHFGLNLFI
jgi:hypothetical protein